MAKKKMKKAKRVLDPTLPVFQLKITLEDIEPPIWRMVQTHDCSLDELHEIIQACMGWEDDHMHAFEVEGREYSSIESDLNEFRDSSRVRLSGLVEKGCYSFDYEYDFGDSWRHAIVIEETLPAAENRQYPFCVDGARACPPEDCGGPWGYPDFLAAIQDPEDERHEEMLEWVGDEFDAEKFDLAEINNDLRHLRSWLGHSRGKHMPEPKFAKGDEIRVKPGVVHVEYPDIPLGGWVGAVTRIAWLVPLDYDIRWTPETLQAAHPVYFKRCQRDNVDPGGYSLEEGQIELNAEHQPPVLEQPTNIVTRPLSPEDRHDRIRMVFGLTSDDPLPLISEQTLGQYLEYLRAHLSFPFDADDWGGNPEYMPDEVEAEQEEEEEEEQESQQEQEEPAKRKVTAVGFAAPSPIDPSTEILCEIRRAQETLQVPLSRLMLNEEDPNCQYVDDYKEWLWETIDRAETDEDDFDEAYYEADDEDFEDEEGGEDEDWDEDDEGWDENDEDWDEGDEAGDEEEDEFGPQDEGRGGE